jgi:hypothetical protein
MPRKSKPVALTTEVLPSTRLAVIPDMRAILDKLVEKKVGELMSRDQDLLFQPYFQGRKVAAEIRRNQTVPEQRRWSRYFKKWGCDVCEMKRQPGRHTELPPRTGEKIKKKEHHALGRCLACYSRTEQRLNEIMAHGASQKGSIAVFLDRQGDLARAALRPASPPLPPEKRLDLEWIARKALKPALKALPAGKSRKRTGRS